MKRLIGEGMTRIFQICHCYRQEEKGHIHNPEFSMLEWYSTEHAFAELIKETDALFSQLLRVPTGIRITYDRLFLDYTGYSAFDFSYDALLDVCAKNKLSPPESFNRNTERDEWLQFVLGMVIEPQLAFDRPVFVVNFPLSQSALAKKNPDGKTAARFEAYYKGIELCNGYDEINSYAELDARMDEINQKRLVLGKTAYKKDLFFLDAMKKSMPPCVGNAMGVDRLIMLILKQRRIADVMPYTTE